MHTNAVTNSYDAGFGAVAAPVNHVGRDRHADSFVSVLDLAVVEHEKPINHRLGLVPDDIALVQRLFLEVPHVRLPHRENGIAGEAGPSRSPDWLGRCSNVSAFIFQPILQNYILQKSSRGIYVTWTKLNQQEEKGEFKDQVIGYFTFIIWLSASSTAKCAERLRLAGGRNRSGRKSTCP